MSGILRHEDDDDAGQPGWLRTVRRKPSSFMMRVPLHDEKVRVLPVASSTHCLILILQNFNYVGATILAASATIDLD